MDKRWTSEIMPHNALWTPVFWNQLDQWAVGASSIYAFKGCLSKIRETRMGFFMD